MNTPVSFEVAKLLKQKHLCLPFKKVYDHGKLKNKPNMSMGCLSDHDDRFVEAPTISDVITGLYKKFDIWIEVRREDSTYSGTTFQAYINGVYLSGFLGGLMYHRDPIQAYMDAIKEYLTTR